MDSLARKKSRVVIVGGGFGGMKAAASLRDAPVDVTLIDRHNYHLFQPLLYQVATAGLSPEDIARPLRSVLRGQKNLDFCLAEVLALDWEEKRVKTSAGDIPFDYLILAAGSETNHFGMETVAAHSLGLKTIEDAVAIRNHVLTQFELAEQETDEARRRGRLTFTVVGGGPTGVECAGALSELIYHVLASEYRKIDFAEVQILLIQAAAELLPAMPEKLQKVTVKTLRKKQVDVRFNTQVVSAEADRIKLKGGEVIPTCTLIWAAGIRSAALSDVLGIKQGVQRRIVVTDTLLIPGREDVFAIGDVACFEQDGAILPTIATVAIQQGEVAARNLRRKIAGQPLIPFRYRDPGSMATIGRNAAVAQIGSFESSGFFAWVLWLVVHIMALVGFRNRVFVFFKWAWEYFFYEKAVRLITKS